MLNLLYLVHRVPCPPNRGDRIRSYHLLRYLATRCNVYLATLADEPVTKETRDELRRLCRDVAIVETTSKRWLRAAWSLATGRSATEGLFASRDLRRAIERWTQTVRFDACLTFCSSMAQYARLPGVSNVPTVVDLVDVDSEKFAEYAASGRGPKRWLHALESARLRRVERELFDWAKAVTLVSQAECDLYERCCPGARSVAITNGVDLSYFLPAADEEGQIPERCVFVGALDYRPNIDGIVSFVRHAWSQLRERRPQATLAIVGRQPDPAVLRLAEVPGVQVIGSVPDVRPFVREASVAVVPLQIARGVQNKVLEALAMGKAVVASPGAAEGLGVSSEHELVVATSWPEWVESLDGLFSSRDRRRRLGESGRRFVELRHSWESNLERFGELLGVASPAVDEREVATP